MSCICLGCAHCSGWGPRFPCSQTISKSLRNYELMQCTACVCHTCWKPWHTCSCSTGSAPLGIHAVAAPKASQPSAKAPQPQPSATAPRPAASANGPHPSRQSPKETRNDDGPVMGGSSTQAVLDVTRTKRAKKKTVTRFVGCTSSESSSEAQADLDNHFEHVTIATCFALIPVLQDNVQALEEKVAELERINHV